MLFLLFLCAASAQVNLGDVPSLVFSKGQYTTRGRAAPVEQLRCTGWCSYWHEPREVLCVNVDHGKGRADPTWACEADLDDGYFLEDTEVVCEGWEHPNDLLVLAGSCSLGYRLRSNAPPLDQFLIFMFLAVVLMFLALWCMDAPPRGQHTWHHTVLHSSPGSSHTRAKRRESKS